MLIRGIVKENLAKATIISQTYIHIHIYIYIFFAFIFNTFKLNFINYILTQSKESRKIEY